MKEEDIIILPFQKFVDPGNQGIENTISYLFYLTDLYKVLMSVVKEIASIKKLEYIQSHMDPDDITN